MFELVGLIVAVIGVVVSFPTFVVQTRNGARTLRRWNRRRKDVNREG